MQHFLEKWDSYLGKLFGVSVAVFAFAKFEEPLALTGLKYFAFVMIGVAIFDTVTNFGQHESKFWHVAAVFSNLFMAVSCILVLQFMLGFSFPFSIAVPDFGITAAIPNFFLYLGIALFIENALWTWVYDRV